MKKTNKTKKLNKFGTVAGALALMSVMQTTNAFAAVPENAKVNVSYDNRVMIPDYAGDYAIVIPSGINFTDAKTVDTAYLAVTDITGEELQGTALQVSVEVESANGYKLRADGVNGELSYTLEAEGNSGIFTEDTSKQAITKKLGLGGNAKRIGLVATMTGDTSKVKDDARYTDTLTFSFTEDTAYAQ